MDKKLLKEYINRTGFQRAGIVGSNPLLRGTTGPNQILKAPRGYTGMQEILAGGTLGAGASKFLKDEDKENLPVETEETKLPKKEPPEDPDILPEIAKQTAEEVIRKEIKEKEPLNKITTWEDHFPTIEEATKAAKDVGGTLEEFEEGVLQKKITFKKLGKDFEVYFDKKLVAELRDVTNLRKETNDQYKNMNAYNLVLLESSGIIDNLVSSFDGMAYAKEATKNVIADGLLDKTRSEGDWSSLRETFQEMEYDKKGQPLTDMEKEERELAERKKNKKAHGGLIDKPLSGGSRYI
tara:strand:+ start:58 stop:942 length:885 start_codon:yes stop_codon:yes gene_type:complete